MLVSFTNAYYFVNSYLLGVIARARRKWKAGESALASRALTKCGALTQQLMPAVVQTSSRPMAYFVI
jgi:hypothetical protein